MKSTVGRLGKCEEAKRGNLWDWVKSGMIDPFFYTGEYRIVTVNN